MVSLRKAKRSNAKLRIGLAGVSGCITGDTVISLNRGKKGYKQTIKKLYECFNGHTRSGKKPDMRTKTKVRSYNEKEKRIVLNEVKAVVYSGKKMVYRLVLENGLYLDATDCHRIMTSTGYVPLGNLKAGDCVMCDNLVPMQKGGKDNLNTHYYMKVMSIEEKGEEDTYDITCKSPNNNFVANGMVIHNSGKTYSALKLAKGLVGSLDKVVLLDTENGSGDLYAHLGDYYCESMNPPYSPDRFVKAIKAIDEIEEIDCIIIDSATHEWSGEGGCLDIHSKLGGQFNDWAKVTPKHRAFIDAILSSKKHVILTFRKKSDYIIELNSKGKNAPKKVGLKDEQRDGFDYELSLSFNIDLNHYATVSKDRTSIFEVDMPIMLGEETGEILAKWARGEDVSL